ncbi:hypothetical protein B296_00006540 [Ensete ventricosum]|uniref:Tetraspanin n=1 Tax=Ensete ventricosum TaxID=4639 RepID=A0A426ZRG8_ENSVE|nr:hypothetical protein B296_00006540 [Ensete ventricosum]
MTLAASPSCCRSHSDRHLLGVPQHLLPRSLDLPKSNQFYTSSSTSVSSPPSHLKLLQVDMGVSNNNITALVNFVGLLCSVPVIGAGIWLASKQGNECVRLARWPVIILGVLLLLVSLAGFVGAYWDKQRLLAAYLFCMAALIVLLLALLIFAFAVSRPDGSYPVPGRAFREYRLDGFSVWLRHYVADHWPQIRTCLSSSDACKKLGRNQPYLTADQFFQTGLAPIQASIIFLSSFLLVLTPCSSLLVSRIKLSGYKQLPPSI